MDLLGFAIGLVVGVPAAIAMAVNLFLLLAALSGKNYTAVAGLLGSLLALPAFDFGGSWVGGKVLQTILRPETINSYIYTSSVVIGIIDFIPIILLLIWIFKIMWSLVK